MAAGIVSAQPEVVILGAVMYGSAVQATRGTIDDINRKVASGEMSVDESIYRKGLAVVGVLPIPYFATTANVISIASDIGPAFAPPTRWQLIQ